MKLSQVTHMPGPGDFGPPEDEYNLGAVEDQANRLYDEWRDELPVGLWDALEAEKGEAKGHFEAAMYELAMNQAERS